MTAESERKFLRRVAGGHNIRLDGVGDILLRARGASVLDIGCSRGMVAYEFANNGAVMVHGCDSYEEGIQTAKEVFADLRAVESDFRVIDLSGGPSKLTDAYGTTRYDIIVMLATYHKLRRVMPPALLSSLMHSIAWRTKKYFVWRATSEKDHENTQEMTTIDSDLGPDLIRVHTSHLSHSLGLAAIWERGR